jgi:hypothetical protein
MTKLGKFLGYKIFADLIYILDFRVSGEKLVIFEPIYSKGLDLLIDERDCLSYK